MKNDWPLGSISTDVLKEHLKRETIPVSIESGFTKEEVIALYKHKLEQIIHESWNEYEQETTEKTA